MQGLEVYHSSNYPLESRKLQKMAAGLKLLPTGGSDFHGSNKPDIRVLAEDGDILYIPYSVLETIKSRQIKKGSLHINGKLLFFIK